MTGRGGTGFRPLPDPPQFESGTDGHDADRGVYGKFTVKRNDGRDASGEKHHDCRYYVLDLDHDPHARPALLAYADSCAADFPLLARDLRALASEASDG